MRYLFHLLLVLVPALARAQTTVQGRVADGKDQSALTGANVLLLHLPDSVKTGTAADAQGRFQFDNVAAGRYQVRVSFLGYAEQRQALTVGTGPVTLGTFALLPGGVALKAVTVTAAAAAVTQHGDTTQFNARAFKTNPDATAGDLVQKLPGVLVGTDGKVQAQGETVTQVLVDGKPFFGTDPDAVLKNLPADAIDKVDIFDQQSEQSKFSGFNDGNTTKTLNFRLKKEYRNGRFGRVVAGGGGGTESAAAGGRTGRYRASGNLNEFHGDRRVSVLAQSNNVNEQNFGTDDLLGVAGGGRGGGGGGGQPGDFLVNQSGGITTTYAAGLNYSNEWQKKTKLTGSYFFNRADNGLLGTTQRYYLDSARTRYNQNATSQNLTTNHRANFRLEQQLDSANSLLLRPSFSYQGNTSTSALLGRTTHAEVPQSTVASQYRALNTGLNLNNGLLLRHRFARPGRTLSLDLTGNYSTKAGTTALQATNSATAAGNLDQRSALDQHGGTAAGNLAYTEPLSQRSQLQATYALSYAPNRSDKRTFDYAAADGTYSRLDSALSNVFDNYYLNQSAGLSLRRNTTKVQASVGLAGQYSLLTSNALFPIAGQRRYDFVNALPSASLTYRLTKLRNLRLNYRTNTDPPSLTQLQAVVNNANPLQLTIGNPALRQEFQHRLALRYTAANAATSGNFFAFIGGSFTQNPVANRTTVATAGGLVQPEGAEAVRLPAGGQLTQPVNLQNEFALRSAANYGRPLPALKLNLNAGVSGNLTQTPGVVNGALNYSRSPSAGLSAGVSSNVGPNLDYNLSTQATQSYVRNTARPSLNSSYFSQVTRLKLGWIFGPGINFQTDLVYQFYRGLSAGYDQPYVLWNASLGKKLFAGQRGEIKLYAFDLLGQNRSIQRNVTEAYYEDVQTTILQRYVQLLFTYNIRSGNLAPPTAPTGEPGRGPDGRGRFGPGGGGQGGGQGGPGGGGFGPGGGGGPGGSGGQ